ncbi:MAG: hypothetical protein AB7O31_18070 [Burkholderiales bacterium]
MHPALIGFLAGLAVAAFFIISEYMMLNASANERAKALKRKKEFDQTARKRMREMWAFAVFLPPAFAIGGWMILPLFGF